MSEVPLKGECDSVCTVSTKRVIERTREMNAELSELIAQRERWIARFVELNQSIANSMAPISTTINAVESLNSPANIDSTTGQAVESLNSPAIPEVVVTKVPVDDDEPK